MSPIFALIQDIFPPPILQWFFEPLFPYPTTTCPLGIFADFDIEDGTKFMLIRKVLPDLTFNGSLRENQLKPVEAFLNSCKPGTYTAKSNGGILSLPCGYGKTICSLYILSKLGKKTLIVVHKEFLMDQEHAQIDDEIKLHHISHLLHACIFF